MRQTGRGSNRAAISSKTENIIEAVTVKQNKQISISKKSSHLQPGIVSVPNVYPHTTNAQQIKQSAGKWIIMRLL